MTLDRFEAFVEGMDEPLEQIVVRTQDSSNGAVLLLHGRGSSPEDMLSDQLYAALDELGADAPVVILPNGGESSYWHDRDAGAWSSYLTAEVLPEAIERADVEGDRVAIGGISMGGFGALALAFDDPERFCAVGGHSPAIFRTWEDSAAGAFDDAEDFERHDLLARAEEGGIGIPVWLDVGEDDPFRATTTELADSLESRATDVSLSVAPGGHDEDYWWARVDDYLGFYSRALTGC